MDAGWAGRTSLARPSSQVQARAEMGWPNQSRKTKSSVTNTDVGSIHILYVSAHHKAEELVTMQ